MHFLTIEMFVGLTLILGVPSFNGLHLTTTESRCGQREPQKYRWEMEGVIDVVICRRNDL